MHRGADVTPKRNLAVQEEEAVNGERRGVGGNPKQEDVTKAPLDGSEQSQQFGSCSLVACEEGQEGAGQDSKGCVCQRNCAGHTK